MTIDPVIARLAAANPVPTGGGVHEPKRLRLPSRAALAAALAAAAVGVPAVAFADDVAGLFRFSNEGTPVATDASPFTQHSRLTEAMEELGFPATLQFLTERAGIRFYAARRANGDFCFAIDADRGKAVGCSVSRAFPSRVRPIVDFSRFSDGARIAGFAADGVSRVALVDTSGAQVASAAVVGNVYAAPGAADAVGVVALDADGKVVYERSFDEAP